MCSGISKTLSTDITLAAYLVKTAMNDCTDVISECELVSIREPNRDAM